VPHAAPPSHQPPQVMGILNLTPDSFSDGGLFLKPAAALAQARQLLAEGADWLDLGGESTRPGAAPVSETEELHRVVPVLQALRTEFPQAKLSVDTSKAAVMQAAIALGVDMLNDVCALQAPGALAVAARSTVAICLMHKQGNPQDMQQHPHYQDVVQTVHDFLAARVQTCVDAGISSSRLYLDPGFGFGKRLSHNLSLMKHLARLHDLGCPLLVGVSRKSMIGEVLQRPVQERLIGGVALAVLAVTQGVTIIRTHEVRATCDALKMVQAVLNAD